MREGSEATDSNDGKELDEATRALLELVEAGTATEIDSYLATSSVHVDAHNVKGETALLLACRLGRTDVAELLLLRGAEVLAYDDDCFTSLLNAAQGGHAALIPILLDAGAEIDESDAFGWTPLMWTAYKDHRECLELLLNRGGDSKHMDDDGLTALSLAAGRGHEEVVERLIDVGASVHVVDKLGNSSLLWACRRGFAPVVSALLRAGAEVDHQGMQSSTPLIMATRGNYRAAVEELLKFQPNVNAQDKDGQTALSIAAREGYRDIADALLEAGAFVNVQDARGDSILLAAVKAGNLHMVNVLLAHYADCDVKDAEGRTPLLCAVDRGYLDILQLLLRHRPQLELRSKEGETALLRAVRNRNVAMVSALLSANAKVSAADAAGDNPLHLSLRSRSSRLTQILLSRPKDARLLYRPNAAGETPYSIDQSSPQPLLPTILGPMESQAETDAMMGYDIYSNVIADILCEPSLNLPLTLGLYAKWGSGKSFLLNKMKEALGVFGRRWVDEAELEWSWGVGGGLGLVGLLVGVLFYSLGARHSADWLPAFTAAILTGLGLLGLYAALFFASQRGEWAGLVGLGSGLGKAAARLRLFLRLLFSHPPSLGEKDVLACPVSFLLADYHRLSSVGGEQALGNIFLAFYDAAEAHFGSLTTRLAGLLRPSHCSEKRERLRSYCGVPVVLGWAVVGLSAALSLLLCCYYAHRSVELEEEETAPTGALVLGAVLGSFAFLALLYPTLLMLHHLIFASPRRQIATAIAELDHLKFEGFMELLQRQVESLAELMGVLDAFTRSQTRLVVFVDGLDNCEQEKMVLTLDALELLFSCRRRAPFAMIIAVDPHIIISAVNRNLAAATLPGTQLTGHHYLKNIVNLPFYLQNSGLRRLQERLRAIKAAEEDEAVATTLRDTGGSFASLRDQIHPAHSPLSLIQGIATDDYFPDINPRSMNRIINTLNLTGRLMRALEMEVEWSIVAHWVALVEQWPYRLSWLIHTTEEEHISGDITLAALYRRIRSRIPRLPSEEPLLLMDRNPENLLRHLTSPHAQLYVHHMLQFVPCTSNLDPYIPKLIREKEEKEKGGELSEEPDSSLALLFVGVVPRPLPFLPSLSRGQVGDLVRQTRLSASEKERYVAPTGGLQSLGSRAESLRLGRLAARAGHESGRLDALQSPPRDSATRPSSSASRHILRHCLPGHTPPLSFSPAPGAAHKSPDPAQLERTGSVFHFTPATRVHRSSARGSRS